MLLSSPISFSICHFSNKTFNGAQQLKVDVRAGKRPNYLRLKCSTISEPWSSESAEVSNKSCLVNEIRKRVDAIKLMLGFMDEAEESISFSAYDTAWVALVEDVNVSGAPQFPSSLQWIINNQLPDGSWGDRRIFLAYDRLLCTLACVIALRFWNVHSETSNKGLKFFRENINKLEKENREHMTCGFETILPALLQMAQSLSIEVPDDFPYLKEICEKRDEKLSRIPWDMIHQVPTSLLFSLESVPGLEWRKLMKLQSPDGSFLFSPSSTAFAFIQTKDENCLTYLNNVVTKFNGGVPDFYPLDLFERMWAIDRLERLGISRYFQQEIKELMNYVHIFWTEKGIGWTRLLELPDVDDTTMGFRLLRLHGYQVSANVFENFKKGDKFFCMPGESSESVTAMYNLYRASQLQLPGEKVLEDAKNFTTKILTEKRASNQLLDKWIIAKGLAGEVSFALDIPWHVSLPRIETRFYLEQYAREDDVWFAKTIYRLHKVSNNIYRELGKLDFNSCQALHRSEWERIRE
ncbi:hypothetical protein L6164_022887 [Bauhinia variegata]|uniref:Uncharacterized protein n=1 Tax=Bauhinia variegata TaxID=167791 RepID=A0ACB9MI22_BAUVA|nr:hypothetical protein L6164_022887 [Bauhinia variegata]